MANLRDKYSADSDEKDDMIINEESPSVNKVPRIEVKLIKTVEL
jgi:hypothetical protein